MLIREIRPTIIRANASEIKSLAGRVDITKGVDSLHSPDEVMEDALELARSTGCVVSVSGALDLIIEGNSMVRVSNGHPMMSKVTGMGCTASAITGALAAINGSPFKAAAHAMAIMGIAGEIAAERSTGPGSFQVSFLDALSSIKETDINERLKI
jgi:hydroxyethylthiazole kinase